MTPTDAQTPHEQVGLQFIVNNAFEGFSNTILSTRTKVLLIGGYIDQASAMKAYIARARPTMDRRRKLSAEEINEKYESNTGKVIVERVGVSDPLAVPAVLVNCHGPFCWGLDPEDAVNNAIALEEIARIAFYSVLLEKRDAIDKVLLDKHFGRKHGKGKYYGQTS